MRKEETTNILMRQKADLVNAMDGVTNVFLSLCDKVLVSSNNPDLTGEVRAAMRQIVPMVRHLDLDFEETDDRSLSGERVPSPASSQTRTTAATPGSALQSLPASEQSAHQPVKDPSSSTHTVMQDHATEPITRTYQQVHEARVARASSGVLPTQFLNGDHLFSSTMNEVMPLPWTHSYNETSFARYLQRSTHEIGLRWLSEPEQHFPELTCRFQFVMHDFQLDFVEVVRWCIFDSIALHDQTMRSTEAPEESRTLPAGTLVSLKTASRRMLILKHQRDTFTLSASMGRPFIWYGPGGLRELERPEGPEEYQRNWMNANEVDSYLRNKRGLQFVNGSTVYAQLPESTLQSTSVPGPAGKPPLYAYPTGMNDGRTYGDLADPFAAGPDPSYWTANPVTIDLPTLVAGELSHASMTWLNMRKLMALALSRMSCIIGKEPCYKRTDIDVALQNSVIVPLTNPFQP